MRSDVHKITLPLYLYSSFIIPKEVLETISMDCVGKDVLHHGHKVGVVLSSSIKKGQCYIKMELKGIKKEDIMAVGPLGKITGWSRDKIYKFDLEGIAIVLERS